MQEPRIKQPEGFTEQELIAWLKVISEPNRLRILTLLMDGEQCNCELVDRLQMKPNLISHHLGILRQAGLVSVERDAEDSRWIYYSINREAFDRMARALRVYFDPERLSPSLAACRDKALVRRKLKK